MKRSIIPLLAALSLFSSACGDDASSPQPPKTDSAPSCGPQTAPRGCDCVNGSSTCPSGAAGGGGAAIALASGAGVSQATIQNLKSARELVGLAGTGMPLSGLAQSSAASADELGPLLKKKLESISPQGNDPKGSGNRSRGSNGSGSGSSGFGLGSLFGHDSGSGTSRANEPQGSPSPSSDAALSGAYTPGKSGDAHGAGSGTPDPFGSLAEGVPSEGSASAEHAQFGQSAKDGLTPVVAPGTTDPEDYFTRTPLNDSLFKVVEKRYQSTTRSWNKP